MTFAHYYRWVRRLGSCSETSRVPVDIEVVVGAERAIFIIAAAAAAAAAVPGRTGRQRRYVGPHPGAAAMQSHRRIGMQLLRATRV